MIKLRRSTPKKHTAPLMMEHSNIAGWTYAVRIHVGNVWTWPKFYFWHFLKWLSVWRRTYASSKESLPSLFQTKEPVWQKRLPFNVCKHNAHLHHLQTLANSNVDANKINAQTIFVYAQTHVNKQLWHLCPMCVCVCVYAGLLTCNGLCGCLNLWL